VLLYVLRSSNGLMTLPLTILMALMIVAFIFTLRVKESALIQSSLEEDE